MIVSLDTLACISRDCKQNNQSVLFVHGCFDILHVGHIELLEYGKKFADNVIVAVNSDETVKLNKGHNRPINRLEYRLKQLDALNCISAVTYINDLLDFSSSKAQTFFNNIEKHIFPNYILTSPENDPYFKKKKERLERLGIELLTYSRQTDISTTQMLEKF